MKKYDCSKVLDFKHEKDRMCKIIDDCDNCCFGHLIRPKDGELLCDWISVITEDEISALQKWSDEHPQRTRAEAFLERVPTCSRQNVILRNGKRVYKPAVCWRDVIDGACECKSCSDCWEQPYHGEFERKRRRRNENEHEED